MPSKQFTVKHEDREMQVIIPDTGDKVEMEALEEIEREKTLDELKKKPKREKSKVSKEDKAGAIKDWRRYLDGKKTRTVGKYFSADYSS